MGRSSAPWELLMTFVVWNTRRAKPANGYLGNESRVLECWTGYYRAPTRRPIHNHRHREGDVTTTLASHPPLAAADRCDRCGAQAYIRVTLPSGGELLFCAHHGRAHETKLREVSSTYHDETEQLVATPGTAPETER